MSARFPRHAAVVAWAQSKLGQAEDPPGSNSGAFVRYCQSHTWLAGTGWAWCVAFCLTAIQEAGGYRFVEPSAGAYDFLQRADRRGLTVPPSAWAKVVPGDVAVWNVGSGHASIVRSFDVVNRTVYVNTIDGNVSDKVEWCRRPLTELRGFVHWPETVTAATPVKVTPPAVQVVGGASGHRRAVHARTGVSVPLPPTITAGPFPHLT